MSIAIETRRQHARSAVRDAVAVERAVPPKEEQLRDMRALMRHFVLALTAAGTMLYGIVASGLMG